MMPSKPSCWILLIVMINLLHSNTSRLDTCFHQIENVSKIVSRVSLSNPRKLYRRNLDLGLKIYAHYDDSIKIIRGFKLIKKDIIDIALQFWHKTLRLRSTTLSIKPIILDRPCVGDLVKLRTLNRKLLTFCTDGCVKQPKCGPINIPAEHLNQCRYIQNGTLMISGMRGKGVIDSDFVLYISSLRTSRCKTAKVLGYAAHCQLSADSDRPIAGYINFCPDALSYEHSDRMRSLFVAKHEILHALGFSTSLFALYRDQNNQPLTPRDPETLLPALGWLNEKNGGIYQWSDRVVRLVNRSWLSAYGNYTKPSHIVVLPTVVKVARVFFNCPTLDGVELEDEDEAGVFLTHWEKRLLENELMTATYTNSYRISPITLAMMEDTGWYTANYSMSQSFSWGKGRGCLFAMASCLEYMLEQIKLKGSISPFCHHLQPPPTMTAVNGVRVSCTPDGESYGFCNLIEHSKPLPPEYSYFVQSKHLSPQTTSSSALFERISSLSVELPSFSLGNQTVLNHVGGQIKLANYCPYHQEIEWENNEGKSTANTHCHALVNSKDPHSNFKLERFGPLSICVEHGPSWRLTNFGQLFAPPVEGAGCYTYRCSLKEGGLILELAGGIAIPCISAAQKFHISACLSKSKLSIEGSLICPNCELYCDPNQCPSSHFTTTKRGPPLIASRTALSKESKLANLFSSYPRAPSYHYYYHYYHDHYYRDIWKSKSDNHIYSEPGKFSKRQAIKPGPCRSQSFRIGCQMRIFIWIFAILFRIFNHII